MRLEDTCREAGVDFQEAARWQHVITQNANLTASLDRYALGDWYVYAGYGAQIAALFDKNGAAFGYFVGIGVDKHRLVYGDHKIDEVDLTSEDFFEQLEGWLYFVAGRYTLLVARGEDARVYGDPVGMNGMVYDEGERQVASSLAMCLNRRTYDHPLYDHRRVERGDGLYSLFHTRDAYAKRGNPNCFVDLNTFSEHRFWPGDGEFQPTQSLKQIYTELSARTQHVVSELNAHYTTVLPLSGGQDSRLIAALTGGDVRNFDLSFTQIHNYASRIDATIAGKVAETLGLPHSTFDKRNNKPAPGDVRQTQLTFETAIGMRLPQNPEVAAGLHLGIADGALVLRGHQTDLLRAVFVDRLGERWRGKFKWQVKRLLLTAPKEFDDAVYLRFLPFYKDWLSTLPAGCIERQVDLMFLEIYYSSTVGMRFPAVPRNFFLSPFNSRHMIGLSLRIDERYRRDGLAVNDLLYLNSPRLHDLPFDHEFGGDTDLALINDQALMDERTKDRVAATRARADALQLLRRSR